MVKNIVVPTVVLTLLSLIVAGLLAFTYNVTGVGELGNGISEEKLEEYKSVVLPDTDALIKSEDFTFDNKDVLGVYLSDNNCGVAIHVQSKGYGDEIGILVGISPDGAVEGVSIVSCSETPGLGSKIKEESYLNNYVGVQGSADDVDTITGATISSTALKKGVNLALDTFEQVKGDIF